MHIGLFAGAIASSMPVKAGGLSQEPQTLAPIPGILDAPNVVILGASIMESAFGNSPNLDSYIADYAAAAGFTGTLWARAQSGEKIAATAGRQTAAAAEPAIAATAGQNLYLVHTGGNNVSSDRPWPGGQPGFGSDYQTLISQITGAGDKVVPMPLTKRLYPSAPQMIHGDAASEANGSKPYNDNVIGPAIDQYAPDWRAQDGTVYVNPYELADRYPQLLESDGVHGFGAALARYILARIAGRAAGKPIGQSRSGSSVLYSINSGDPREMSIGTRNVFKSYPAGFTNQPLLCGAIAQDGSFDPFVELIRGGVFRNYSGGAGTGTFARIPDTRFHIPELVNSGIYFQGTDTFTLEFGQLTPGDTVTLTAVGVRSAGGTNRRSRMSLSTGEVLDLDAASSAVSNQATFAPVTVPANGKLGLTCTVAPGATYGYLHGVMLDFA